jgi:hypothetical protein
MNDQIEFNNDFNETLQQTAEPAIAPRPHKIRIEMVYRVWRELDITEENYSNALEEATDENATLEQAAFDSELKHDEEEIFTQVFEEEIAANGPDDVYILVQLLDPDGNVLKQGTVEGNDHAASVHPQYQVSGMEVESSSS